MVNTLLKENEGCKASTYQVPISVFVNYEIVYDCFVVVFLQAVNGILGAGSYGIAMAKHSPYISNISVAILKLQETSVLSKGVQQVCVRLVYAL